MKSDNLHIYAKVIMFEHQNTKVSSVLICEQRIMLCLWLLAVLLKSFYFNVHIIKQLPVIYKMFL